MGKVGSVTFVLTILLFVGKASGQIQWESNDNKMELGFLNSGIDAEVTIRHTCFEGNCTTIVAPRRTTKIYIPCDLNNFELTFVNASGPDAYKFKNVIAKRLTERLKPDCSVIGMAVEMQYYTK